MNIDNMSVTNVHVSGVRALTEHMLQLLNYSPVEQEGLFT